MNHIFKIKRNHLGQSVVTSELAKARGKMTAIAVAVCSALLSLSVSATPVTEQGTATSENAIAIGSSSFATAISGIATGFGSIATGDNFSREDFLLKKQENDALIDAANQAQSDVNNTNNNIAAMDDAITSLGEQITHLTNQQANITQKIAEKDRLDAQSGRLTDTLNDQKLALSDAKSALDQILSNGKNLYLNFTDELNSLNWSALNGTDAGRNTIANELKSRIEQKFPEIATKYDDAKYRAIIDGYINRQAQYQGSYESLATETYTGKNNDYGRTGGYQDRFKTNKNVLLNQWYFSSSLDKKDYDIDKTKSKYTIALESISGGVSSGGASGTNFGNRIRIDNQIENYNRKAYSSLNFNLSKNNESGLNAALLTVLSKQKADLNNEFTAINSFSTGFEQLLSTNLMFGNDNFETAYNSWSENVYASNVIQFNVKTTHSTTSKQSPYFYDENIGVLTKIKDMTVNNQNLISTDDISHFKRFYQNIQDKYNTIDWNFNRSAYDLTAYRASFDKVLAYNAKINSLLDIYQSIINERKKDNANQAQIETWTQELMNLKQQILDGTQDKTNFGMGMELVLNQTNADYYLNYANDEAQRTIARINSELKLYDDKDQLVVDVTSKAKELQKAYDDAKRAADNTQAELDAVNKQISNLALTEEERKVDDLKDAKEKELEVAKRKKEELEDQLEKQKNALETAQNNLKNSGLKDLGLRSQAYGDNAFASGDDSIALGTNATAIADHSIAIGLNSSVTGTSSLAVGTNSVVSGDNALALGTNNVVSGNRVSVIGQNNTVESNDVMVLGNNITISRGFDGAVVLGNGSTVEKANPTESIVLNNVTYTFAGTTPTATVSVGAEGEERQVVNVAAGRITSTSTDAINGSQLYAVTEAVNGTADVVRGIADEILGKGNLSFTDNAGNTATVKLGNALNVAGDQNIKTVIDPTTNTLSVTLANNVTADRFTAGNVSLSVDGINAGNKKVSNVAAGDISPDSTEAVNGSQLYAVAGNVITNAQNLANLNDKVSKGWNIATNEGEQSANVQMGDTVTLNQGNNIVITQSGQTITVATSSTPTFDKVNVGNVSIDGERIRGIANGVEDSDAVNMSQLNATNNSVIQNTLNIFKNAAALAKGLNTATDDGVMWINEPNAAQPLQERWGCCHNRTCQVSQWYLRQPPTIVVNKPLPWVTLV
ncbi:hypothetical protein B0187_00800 [Haemophilus paracuniculus]|uniref:Trimeric autotransporter adhesin YadA-like stalk domain-containing protein n=2 Tax=Haemophilus paracuniculus TaxID=734 RepID=A0A1T0AVY6_9PAST|nr:hypothetical protein B0187_00800 [Haemophilus paracuniculus]